MHEAGESLGHGAGQASSRAGVSCKRLSNGTNVQPNTESVTNASTSLRLELVSRALSFQELGEDVLGHILKAV